LDVLGIQNQALNPFFQAHSRSLIQGPSFFQSDPALCADDLEGKGSKKEQRSFARVVLKGTDRNSRKTGSAQISLGNQGNGGGGIRRKGSIDGAVFLDGINILSGYPQRPLLRENFIGAREFLPSCFQNLDTGCVHSAPDSDIRAQYRQGGASNHAIKSAVRIGKLVISAQALNGDILRRKGKGNPAFPGCRGGSEAHKGTKDEKRKSGCFHDIQSILPVTLPFFPFLS
jgi:hypothetical protein